MNCRNSPAGSSFLSPSVSVQRLSGAIATTPEIEGWYRTLQEPSWNPPDWIFGPFWTTLYILMAVAAWLVWGPAGFATAATPLSLFGVQLAMNIAWSWILFGLHQPGWAFADIVFLWLAVAAKMPAFFRSSPVAGCLMLPHPAWVSFAAVLNFTIWRMNS